MVAPLCNAFSNGGDSVLSINNKIGPYFFIGLLDICALLFFAQSAENNPEALFSQVPYSLKTNNSHTNELAVIKSKSDNSIQALVLF